MWPSALAIWRLTFSCPPTVPSGEAKLLRGAEYYADVDAGDINFSVKLVEGFRNFYYSV